jgi:hypothetical protein
MSLQQCLYYIKLDPLLRAVGVDKKQRSSILVRRRCNALTYEDVALIAHALRKVGINDVMRHAGGDPQQPEMFTTQEVQS